MAITSGAPALHLNAVNIVDVTIRDVLWKSSITLSAGRITAIGEKPPPDAAVLDLPGYWAAPSLVDMHTHITLEPRAHHPGVMFDHAEDAAVATHRAVRNLGEALRVGICMVRDVGGRGTAVARVREIAGRGQVILPELVTSGEPLCIPGGHGSEFGQFLLDPTTLREVLRKHRQHGHEWLKIMNGPELWPSDLLTEIVATARQEGLRVAIHAFTAEGIRDAVRSAPNTIEHAMICDEELIQVARRNKVSFVPTYYCSWLSLRPRFTWTQSNQEISHLQAWKDQLDRSRPTHVANKLPVLPGTDAGCAPCTFDDYIEELIQFERWSLPPIDILRSASLDAATGLGRAGKFGSIAVGKWANLIVCERSPLDRLSNLHNPALVLFKGADTVNLLGERWS